MATPHSPWSEKGEGRERSERGWGSAKLPTDPFDMTRDLLAQTQYSKMRGCNRETREVQYKGNNIADMLRMTVEGATGFFKSFPKIYRKPATRVDGGLGRMGQPATTPSGGEARRGKLAAAMGIL